MKVIRIGRVADNTLYLSQAYLVHRVQKFSYKSKVRITGEKLELIRNEEAGLR